MAHRWQFFRAGGFDQVRLETGADLRALSELDPKLWVALACPAKGIELDAHALQLLDGDADGRIRVPDAVAAARWTCALLKNADEVMQGSTVLPLASIDETSPEGKQVLASAREILRNLGKANSASISQDDTADTVKIFAATHFNGDGVIPPEAAGDDGPTAAAVRQIIACLGPVKDVSGLDGVSAAQVEEFFTQVDAFIAWWKTGEGSAEILVLGPETPAAFQAYLDVKPKVDDFFARCGLASMDPAATHALNPPESVYTQLATTQLSAAHPKLIELPIARVAPGSDLPLKGGINPAWVEALGVLNNAVVVPLLGPRESLSGVDWAGLGSRFAPYEQWMATKPPGSVEKLGIVQLRELAPIPVRAAIKELLAKDLALEPEAKAIASVDRLATYYVHLAQFLNNFVAFKDFYTRKKKAAFQAGTLFLDGRSCELCLRIEDATKHATVAPASMTCLVYCDCTRTGTAEKMGIVAAFTGGDADFLRVGRNGIFYDRRGRDWDATITRVLEQPISLRQAFWAPYKRLARFISEQAEKVAGARDKAASEHLHQGLQKTVVEADAPGAPEKPPFDVGKFAGIFAAIGLALGMVGSAIAAVLTGFWELKGWQMPLAALGVVLVISGPSVAFAAMKLHKRNLGPLLDACGWAINARARINIPFGGSLTGVAALPAGSRRALTDPFADKKRPWWLYITVAALIAFGIWAWRSGYLVRWIAALHR